MELLILKILGPKAKLKRSSTDLGGVINNDYYAA
jgi:hypothetical protein